MRPTVSGCPDPGTVTTITSASRYSRSLSLDSHLSGTGGGTNGPLGLVATTVAPSAAARCATLDPMLP